MIKLCDILFESKQNLLNLGFPEVVSSILEETFGTNAFTIAKWFREYMAGEGKHLSNWWKKVFRHDYLSNNIKLASLVELYKAAQVSADQYDIVRKEFNLGPSTDFDQTQILQTLKEEIKNKLLNEEEFFTATTMIEDIMSGKLKNIQPYKKLSFKEAKDKYDIKNIFSNTIPIKTYENGWKWINVGKRCQLVGSAMKNCGSVGVMSYDEDRTMLVLFDNHNKPHVVATYSPNEKKLSRVEGGASTIPREEFDNYILDLVDVLGIQFDTEKSNSKSLKLKSLLKDKYSEITRVSTGNSTNEYFLVVLKNGNRFYTNSYSLIPANRIETLIRNNDPEDTLRAAFDYYSDVSKINLQDFVDKVN